MTYVSMSSSLCGLAWWCQHFHSYSKAMLPLCDGLMLVFPSLFKKTIRTATFLCGRRSWYGLLGRVSLSEKKCKTFRYLPFQPLLPRILHGDSRDSSSSVMGETRRKVRATKCHADATLCCCRGLCSLNHTGGEDISVILLSSNKWQSS